ncbi:MAG: glycosyltransferase family 4 protein [Candidatus Nanoarchaeia archaeon]|nr:glycosyltransferase family 4 protein [Candidatus Nanoarchaeia archaeon]
MKVIRTIESFYPYVTGPANQAFNISKGLYKQGIESPIFTSFFNAENSKKHEYFNSVPVTRFKIERRLMKYIMTPSMKKAIEKEDFDIIHSHGYRSYQSSLGYGIARKMKKPFVVNTHGMLSAYNNFNMGFLSKLPYITYDIATLKNVVKKANMVVTSSDKEYSEALKFGIKKEKLKTIPAGININDYTPEKSDSSKINLLFVGRISRNRNLEPIINAMKFLDNEKVRLTIVGEEAKSSETSRPGYVKELKKLSKGLNVDFTGPKYGKNLINYYKNSDIFVYTSFYENFGQTILEAGAAALPIITTKVGVAEQIINHNENGFFVDFNNPKKIADYVKELSSKTKRQNFGKKAREKVRKDFGWENIIKKYVEIYNSIS